VRAREAQPPGLFVHARDEGARAPRRVLRERDGRVVRGPRSTCRRAALPPSWTRRRAGRGASRFHARPSS
jgi:hypothetical protein